MNSTADRLRETVVAIAQANAVRLVVLFGSSCRHESRPPEDLDIGFLGDAPLDLLDLTNQLIRRLGIQNVDVVDLGRAEPLLLALAARDGVPLYERSPGEFSRFVSLAARRFADTRKFRDTERREIVDFLAEPSPK